MVCIYDAQRLAGTYEDVSNFTSMQSFVLVHLIMVIVFVWAERDV